MLIRALLVAALATASLVPPGGAHEFSTPQVTYRLGLLVRGKAWSPVRTARTDSIQAGHMANMARMWHHGALLVAGPFENGGDLRGVFVFRPGDDPLDSLMAGDSAIASGRLECRLLPWVAPAGLGEDYKRNAEQVARTGQGKRDSMVTFAWVLLEKGPRHGAGDPAAAHELADRHLAHAEKLRASGRVVFAGTVPGEGDLRGVLVMKGDSAQAAAAMADDPAVREGWFTPRVLKWWTARGNIPGH